MLLHETRAKRSSAQVTTSAFLTFDWFVSQVWSAIVIPWTTRRHRFLLFFMILIRISLVTALEMDSKSIRQESPSTVMTRYKSYVIVLLECFIIILLKIFGASTRLSPYNHLINNKLIRFTSSKLLGCSGTGLLSFKGFLLSSSSHFCLQLFKWISNEAVPYSLPL